jgi:hypothetical protein
VQAAYCQHVHCRRHGCCHRPTTKQQCTRDAQRRGRTRTPAPLQRRAVLVLTAVSRTQSSACSSNAVRTHMQACVRNRDKNVQPRARLRAMCGGWRPPHTRPHPRLVGCTRVQPPLHHTTPCRLQQHGCMTHGDQAASGLHAAPRALDDNDGPTNRDILTPVQRASTMALRYKRGPPQRPQPATSAAPTPQRLCRDDASTTRQVLATRHHRAPPALRRYRRPTHTHVLATSTDTAPRGLHRHDATTTSDKLTTRRRAATTALRHHRRSTQRLVLASSTHAAPP